MLIALLAKKLIANFKKEGERKRNIYVVFLIY